MLKRTVITTFLLICLGIVSGCASQETRLVNGKQNFMLGDYHQAFLQLQPLAVKQNPDAQYAVGYMYYYGLGTSQNTTIALKWLESAAAQGQPQAKQALDMIDNREVVNEPPQNAVFTNVPPNYDAEVAAAMEAEKNQ